MAAAPKPYEAFVLMAETNLLFHLTPIALFPALLVTGALVWALWGVAPRVWLLAWATGVAAPTLSRIVLWRISRRMPPEERLYRRRRRLYFILTLFAGAAWGALSFLVDPMNSPMHMAFVAIMLAGVTGGAVGPYGATAPRVFAAYILLILAPFALRLLSADEPLWIACGVISMLYAGTLIVVGFRFGRTTRQAMELQLYNADLVAELKDAEQRILHLAMHDPLTGLANRRLLEELYKPSAANAHRRNAIIALYFFDLDSFKPINDEWGHGVGDQALKTVAERLRQIVRPSDCVARVGGDEFVVLAVDIKERGVWEKVARKIHDAVSAPMDIRVSEAEGADNVRFQVGASIGVSLFPEQGRTLEELLRLADTAMYAVKADKKSPIRWKLYSPDIESTLNE
jgi:diguanylate cyclase (GGDEF)-like protein